MSHGNGMDGIKVVATAWGLAFLISYHLGLNNWWSFLIGVFLFGLVLLLFALLDDIEQALIKKWKK